jgi:hypothetical protein
LPAQEDQRDEVGQEISMDNLLELLQQATVTLSQGGDQVASRKRVPRT